MNRRHFLGIAASLLFRSFVELRAHPLGFESPGRVAFRFLMKAPRPWETWDRAIEAVRAVLANRFAVRTPWLVKFTPALRALLPRRAFNAVAAAFGVNTSMMEWRGRR